MSITLFTAAIMAAQVAANLVTQKHNRENAQKIRDLKEQYKLDALAREQLRDHSRFLDSCKKQRDIEIDAHNYKLACIETEFKNAFDKKAHILALNNYPLLISPYIVKNCILPFGNGNFDVLQPPIPFCILTNSNNSVFNEAFIPFLDEAVNEYVAFYWNTYSTHTVCYYKGAWNEDVPFDDIHPKNIQGLIPTAPIILFTPYLVPAGNTHKLYFKIRYWGMDEIFYEPEGIEPFNLRTDNHYSPEKMREIVKSLTPHLICLLGFYVDLYYWVNCFMQPLLPSLLDKGLFKDDGLQRFYKEGYIALLHRSFNTIPPKTIDEGNVPLDLSDIVSVNTFLYPDKTVGLLESAVEIAKDNSVSEHLIMETIAFIYGVRTGGESIHSFDEMDVYRFDETDLAFIRRAADVARKFNLTTSLHGLSGVLRREIMATPL